MSPRRSPLRVFAGRYLVAFVVASFFMSGAVFAVNYVIDRKLAKVPRVDVKTAPAPAEGANYLVIGSDTRAFVENAGEEKAFGNKAETGGQRSDTLMVAHVEPGAQQSTILSFPRDLLVNIPGVGRAKLNSAFNNGGPNKVIDTLKANFGVEINHYIEVNFITFQGVVRAIGNVPVYFPYPARDDKTGLYIFAPGCNRLNGPASLAYVRSRTLQYYSQSEKRWLPADPTADLGRIARQQDFIRRLAALAVAKSLDDPGTANEIADRVLENLHVDRSLSKRDIFDIIDAFRTVNPSDTSALHFETFPWKEGPSVSGVGAVLYPREEASTEGPGWRTVVDRLSDFTHASRSSSTTPPQVKVQVRNGSGQEGTAAAVLAQFKRIGFKGAGFENDARGTVRTTEVRYRPGESAKGRLLLEYLPSARLVEDPHLPKADVAVVLGADFSGIVEPVAPTTAPETPTTSPASRSTTTDRAETPPIANQSELGSPAPHKPPC